MRFFLLYGCITTPLALIFLASKKIRVVDGNPNHFLGWKNMELNDNDVVEKNDAGIIVDEDDDIIKSVISSIDKEIVSSDEKDKEVAGNATEGITNAKQMEKEKNLMNDALLASSFSLPYQFSL